MLYLFAVRTSETKLRVFQFKLVHRRIATNNYLFKKDLSSTCNFCEEKVEKSASLPFSPFMTKAKPLFFFFFFFHFFSGDEKRLRCFLFHCCCCCCCRLQSLGIRVKEYVM